MNNNDDKPKQEKTEKQYELIFGYNSKGLTIWNRLEEAEGDYFKRDSVYVTVAQIDRANHVTYLETDTPSSIKALIKHVAENCQIDDFKPTDSESARLPDMLITEKDRNAYGYTYDDMLPLTLIKAYELFKKYPVYMLHRDNTETLAFNRNEILWHDGICGIRRLDWESKTKKRGE
jgi:hypothetical protein